MDKDTFSIYILSSHLLIITYMSTLSSSTFH
nr:MAG TPA: hypothetical protein [Caudoviricetes sp.]